MKNFLFAFDCDPVQKISPFNWTKPVSTSIPLLNQRIFAYKLAVPDHEGSQKFLSSLRSQINQQESKTNQIVSEHENQLVSFIIKFISLQQNKMDKAQKDNRADQKNPNNEKTGSGKDAGYHGDKAKSTMDNKSNQQNQNNPAYKGGQKWFKVVWIVKICTTHFQFTEMLQ